MGRNRPGERFLLGCLLVAVMVGTIALKVWVVSVEQRLADNLEIHWDGVGTTHSQTNVLEIHEGRLRRVEHSVWVIRDRQTKAPQPPTRQDGGSE